MYSIMFFQVIIENADDKKYIIKSISEMATTRGL